MKRKLISLVLIVLSALSVVACEEKAAELTEDFFVGQWFIKYYVTDGEEHTIESEQDAGAGSLIVYDSHRAMLSADFGLSAVNWTFEKPNVLVLKDIDGSNVRRFIYKDGRLTFDTRDRTQIVFIRRKPIEEAIIGTWVIDRYYTPDTGTIRANSPESGKMTFSEDHTVLFYEFPAASFKWHVSDESTIVAPSDEMPVDIIFTYFYIRDEIQNTKYRMLTEKALQFTGDFQINFYEKKC